MTAVVQFKPQPTQKKFLEASEDYIFYGGGQHCAPALPKPSLIDLEALT